MGQGEKGGAAKEEGFISFSGVSFNMVIHQHVRIERGQGLFSG